MKVLEKAKQAETRERFAESRIINRYGNSRRYSEEELNSMCEYILGDECVRDIERLEKGDFFFDYLNYRLIPKNFQGKKRAIYFFDGTEALLMKLIVYSMRGIERIYSDRLFSFRSDRTGVDLLEELTTQVDIGSMYVLKTDISSYVGSIVPELLVPMLEEVFLPDDPEFFELLKWMVMRGKVRDVNGDVIDHCAGGLGGVPVGNFFMNLYLHEMDEYYAPRAAFYSRYSDDVLICAKTYEEICLYEKKFFEFLDRLHLTTNKEKTLILNPGEPFELLGMEICGDKIGIADHSMKKIKRKIRIYANKVLVRKNRGLLTADEAATVLIERFNQLFFGIFGDGKRLTWAKWAFPVINDMESLKEIDHYLQDSLRYVIYGSMKDRNRSVPYEKFEELGYKSLVYYYHHPDKITELLEKYRKDPE